MDEFFRTPQQESERETILKPGEIVGEIHVPAAGQVLNATYEVREKEALDWPLVTASVALKLSEGRVAQARIVLGHVAPIPWNAVQAAKRPGGQGDRRKHGGRGRRCRRCRSHASEQEWIQGSTGPRGGETGRF